MSLKSCLISQAKILKDFDTSILDEIVRNNIESRGMSEAEAEKAAIEEKLAEIRVTKKRIEEGIVKAYEQLDPDAVKSIRDDMLRQQEQYDRRLSALEQEREAKRNARIEAEDRRIKADEENRLLAREEMVKQIEQLDIDKAVAQTAEEEQKSLSSGVFPKFSSRAQPRSQYVARNPDKGLTPTKELMASLSRDPEKTNLSPEFIKQSRRILGDTMKPDETVKSKSKKVYEAFQVPKETQGQTFMRVLGENRIGFWISKLRQNAIDRWARVEKYYRLEEFAQVRPEESAISAVRMFDRAHGFVASAIYQGNIAYKNGRFYVEDFMAPGVDGNDVKLAGLVGIFGHLVQYTKPDSTIASDRERLAHMWLVLQRGELLNSQNLLTPIPKKELDSMMEMTREEMYKPEHINPYTGESYIIEFEQLWRNYNKKTAEFLRDTGVIPESMMQRWIDEAAYVPFYREQDVITDNGKVRQNRFFSGLKGVTHFAPIGHGSDPVSNNMMENIVRNLGTAITMGMQNVTQQRIVRDMVSLNLASELGPNESKGDYNTVSFRVDGKAVTYALDDPLIYEAMLPLDGALSDTLTAFLSPASKLLRETITRDPAFWLANGLRDTLSAWVTSGAEFVPIIDSLVNATKDIHDFERMAIAGGYDLRLHDFKDIQKFFLKKYKEKYNVDSDGHIVWKGIKHVWDVLGDVTTASDMVVRRAVYDDVLARTGNETEAQIEAYEVINFATRGRHPLMRVMTSAVPFLNPKIQGIDLLYRAMSGKYTAHNDMTANLIRKKFMMRGLMLMALSGLYYMLVQDDDDYIEQSDEIRDNNFIIPLGDKLPPVKLPIPFEVGLLFKTLPERILATYNDQSSAEENMASFKRAILHTFGVSPLNVQAIAPLMETKMNYDSYTGRPIVPNYMQDVVPEKQFNYNTSELAVQLGEALNMSPMKIDHIMSGYLGTLGVYGLEIIDIILRSAPIQGDNKRARPTRDFSQLPLLRRFFTSERGKGLQQDFYDMHTLVNGLVVTINDIRKRGDMEEFLSFRDANGSVLEMRSMLNTIETEMAEYREKRRKIEESNMEPNTKKAYMDMMDDEMNEYLHDLVPMLRQAFNNAKISDKDRGN